ncbi:MAG: domain containing protein [Myxococcales bacterium]|nr:domain containing protein [Myxococcales bacterium]
MLLGPPALADKFNWAGKIAVDSEDLKSEDPKKRLEAVSKLGGDDNIELTQAYLLRALTDEDEAVRHAAARALGNGGATAAVPTMIDWLAASEPKTKSAAAEVLGDIGTQEAAQALTRSLGDPDAGVRQRAVKALGKIGLRGNPAVVIAMIPRLEDDKSEVRREAVDQLEQLGDKRAVIPLVARFGDTSPEVRKSAVRAVGKLGDRSAVPALVRLMNDPDEGVRMAAAGSLGALGAIEAIDALTEQLNTGSDAFKGKVAYSLGQIASTPGSGKAGEDAMHKLVENLVYAAQRKPAQEALRVAGKAAVPALVASLSGRIAGDPTTAVTLLSETADPRATAALTAELERGRVATPLVLKALGSTGDPAALVPVLGTLSNKDAAIRIAAMDALRPLLGTDARAGDVLVEHLTDEDLEVRVLAAEYLGVLKVSSAAPKLTALAGAGNPTRLRLAAIDALGSIGSIKYSADATKTLLDVLREGPADLHRAAATALSYIADPAVIPMLVAQVQTDRGPTRYQIVRALGATLRDHDDAAGRKLLRELAQDSNVKVALAAIAGLAAANRPEDAPLLRAMVEQAAEDRRRAAAWALGELHDPTAFDTLSNTLGVKDDRLAGDAVWALGELAANAPADGHVPALTERWLYLARHAGWATSINSAAAIARTLRAEPPKSRAELIAGTRRATLLGLAFHKSRLVRINLIAALSSLGPDPDILKTMIQLLKDDASSHVRTAAATGLARIAIGANHEVLGRVAAALKTAADTDPDASVRQAAKVAQGGAPTVPAREQWVSYYVIDPTADDSPVRQEPYFVHTADGIVCATYTDARGELSFERVPAPAGEATVSAASREGEY